MIRGAEDARSNEAFLRDESAPFSQERIQLMYQPPLTLIV